MALNKKKPVYDLDEIKNQAQKSLRDGSVTKDYPLDIDEASYDDDR